MKGGLSTSLSAANTLSPDLKNVVDTSAITNAMDQTTKIQELCKGLSTDECANKQAQLQADNDIAQLKFYNDTLAASVKQLSDVRVAVQAKFDEINKAKASAAVFKGDEMIPQFQELLSRIDGDILVLKKSVPYINPPESTSVLSSGSSGSNSTRPDYVLPTTGTKSGYESELDLLRIKYNSLMGIATSPDDMTISLQKWAKYTLIPIAFYISVAFAAVLGGIVCANIFIEEESLYVRLYYFVYGMLGFPAVLMYAAVKPPFWNSNIPIYPRLTAADTSAHPSLIEVIEGKKSSTIEGIPAPDGMMWIKKASSNKFFSYLISLGATILTVDKLPGPPTGYTWNSTAATSKQQLWSLLKKAPAAST